MTSCSCDPIKNEAFTFYVSLTSRADTNVFQVAPTLAIGDVKISIDGGPFANLATLPAVTPAGSTQVQVSLSAEEMNGDDIAVRFSDVAGAEWCDLNFSFETCPAAAAAAASSTCTEAESTPCPTGGWTLKAQRKASYYALQLNTCEFAEPITYMPFVGASRTITAKIAHRQKIDDRGQVDTNVEQIVVTVGKDQDHAKGGVPLPQRGDALIREGEEHMPRFAFTGQIDQQTPHSWWLIFERPTPQRLGDIRRK